MRRFLSLVLVVVVVAPLAAACGLGAAGSVRVVSKPPARDAGAAGEADLLTVAESSGFRATARHDDVVALLDRLAAAAPGRARRVEMGTTVEGRSIPMLVVADPPVATPEEAAEQVKRGKLVALMIGNIHGGEVDGKEALPMLAREVLLHEGEKGKGGHPLLKDLVLVFAPIYNADGNERVGKDNRPGQVGPEEGMGIRENAQGFDLNRDFVKLEAPETRALVRVMREWDPAVFIDTHTTNGSYHGYVLTFEGPKVPAGDGRIVEYVRDEMLPRVSRGLEEGRGVRTWFYGDFAEGHTKWVTFPPLPRYGTNYVGLRNRISILSEGYSYAPYEDRVMATLHFVRACLEDVAANKEKVKKLLREADEGAVGAGREPGEGDVVVLRAKSAPAPGKVKVAGFVEEEREGRMVSTGEARVYEVEHWNRAEATLTAPRPFAYLIPEALAKVVEVLQRHGVEVEELREDIELEVEVYRIDAVKRAVRVFQGHMPVTVEATAQEETRRVPAGTRLVRTGQRLGTLAAYLLEPMAEDGLATWNFLDEQLVVGESYPIVRVKSPTPITSGAVRPLEEERGTPRLMTFEEFYEGGEGGERAPNLSGSPVGGIEWLEDGEHFIQRKDRKVWRVHAATGRAELALDPGPIEAALAGLATISEKDAARLAGRAWGALSKDRSVALLEHGNDLYYVRADGSAAGRLTSTPQREELASLSPDGAFAAFVRENNLYVVDVATGTERQLTTDGSATVLNGKADWVYFEEVFGRNWRTYWWSPDSRRIAFLRMDTSRVPEFTLVDDLGDEQRLETVRYPRPGEPNPAVRLGIVGVEGGEPVYAGLGAYDVDASLITGVGWWPDSGAVWCYVQDRGQTWLDVVRAPVGGGEGKRLLRETTGAWVDNPEALLFLADGSFLITSERTGWKHLYRYDKAGKEVGALTGGEWEVREVHVVDEERGWVYLSGTRDSHTAVNLYRVRLDGSGADEGGEGIERLTSEEGWHRVTVSPKGNLFVDSWSSRERPTRVAVRSCEDGSVVRMVDTNPVYALEEFIRHPSERFRIATRDGFEMEAAWTRPAGFDPARKHPVWVMTYAGPKSPTIRDAWNPGVWDQALATAGVVTLRVDPRSASGKGAVHAWTAYKQLGVQELKDLEDAVEWLRGHEWVDGERIGLSGHSYGGFMTAYALTHSDAFAAGIAGAPVTDWREYDTIYTERYMGTPQENPEGYDASSAVKGAKGLKGRLLIAHGGLDDNVHPANTWKLVRALQRAGKQFELAIYPANRHGIGGRQYQRLMYEFILKTMRPGGSLADEEVAAGADGGS